MHEYVRIYETLYQSSPDDDKLLFMIYFLFFVNYVPPWFYLIWITPLGMRSMILLTRYRIIINDWDWNRLDIVLWYHTTLCLNRCRERKPHGCFATNKGGHGIYVIYVKKSFGDADNLLYFVHYSIYTWSLHVKTSGPFLFLGKYDE